MVLELSFYRALCSHETFAINGIAADSDDFGNKGDCAPELAEPYGCGDMQFTRRLATDSVLLKYNINLSEYDEICQRLEDGLSFGMCGWCV